MMNERSSRAHSVVVVSIDQRCTTTNARMQSRLFLADLGGSEKMSQSEADSDTKAAGSVAWEEYYANRQRLRETININSGLFVLKKCIDALNDRELAAQEGRPLPYVPYQVTSKQTCFRNHSCAFMVRV